MKRFHRYLQTGSVNAPKVLVEEEEKKQNQQAQNAHSPELNEFIAKLRATVEEVVLEQFGKAVPEVT